MYFFWMLLALAGAVWPVALLMLFAAGACEGACWAAKHYERQQRQQARNQREAYSLLRAAETYTTAQALFLLRPGQDPRRNFFPRTRVLRARLREARRRQS